MVPMSTLLILTVFYVSEADSANCPCFSASDVAHCYVDPNVCPEKVCWLYEWQGTYGGVSHPLYPNFALHCSNNADTLWWGRKRYLVQKGSSGSAFCKAITYDGCNNCNNVITGTIHHTGLSVAQHEECAEILKDQAFDNNGQDCFCGDATDGYFLQSECKTDTAAANPNWAQNNQFCYDGECPAGSPALENAEDMDMNEYEIKVASAQESSTTISLSTGAFIGIIFGVIILSIMFTAFVVWVYRKNKMNKYDLAAVKEEEDDDEEEQDETTKITEN